MTTSLTRNTTVAALAIALATLHSSAQTAAAPQQATTQAAATSGPTFPPVDPRKFTATAPTVLEVNTFLRALWGYDENRSWSVAAILKTQAPGVAKVVVYVAEKGMQGKGQQAVFFTTPDGQHAIATDQVVDFGIKPFAATRALLQTQASGPAQGAASKDLLLVEFADLQCVHCKDAQDTIDKLLNDFPQARIVYENFPIKELHPYAVQAAAEGVCIRKAKGDAAFFKYARSVYDHQAGLTPATADATLATAATVAGAAPAAVATCAATPEALAQVQDSIDLGTKVGVDSTPTLFVNGHALPIGGGLPYETLRKIIAFQGQQDGLNIRFQPSLTNLK